MSMFKPTFKQCTLAAILAVTLSACSSGGNSNKAPTNSGTTAQPPASQAGGQGTAGSVVNQSGSNSGSEGASNSGNSGAAGNGGTVAPTPNTPTYGGSVFSTEDKSYTVTPSTSKNLVLDGKTIVLNQPQAGFDWIGGTNLQYSEFGVYVDNNKRDSDNEAANIIYAYGQITPVAQLPKGSAQYTGKGFYGSEALRGFVPVTSSFNVDFDNKTLNGKLEEATKAINVSLTAKIEGSSFHYANGGVSVKGNFFGPNGEELGGAMLDSINGRAASFGATRR